MAHSDRLLLIFHTGYTQQSADALGNTTSNLDGTQNRDRLLFLFLNMLEGRQHHIISK